MAVSERAWLAELAWSPALGLRTDVLLEATGSRFTAVTPDAEQVPAATARLAGLTMPGLANAHSHAFHRALRGVTQASHGTFWTWRERMYEGAYRLGPPPDLALAPPASPEITLAGGPAARRVPSPRPPPPRHRLPPPTPTPTSLPPPPP